MIEGYDAGHAASGRDAAALAHVARKLPAAVTITLLGATAGLALLLVLVNRGDWWRGLLAAGVVSILAAAPSLAALLWGLRGGIERAPAGLMAATAIRAAISIGGAALAAGVGGFPPRPTFLLMMAYYFAVLAVETALISGALWPAAKQTTTTSGPKR
jgi:hypothetical protein